MTVREALRQGVSFLTRASVDTPSLDANLLLGEALRVSQEALIASYPDDLEPAAYDHFQELLRRRGEGVPVSYLRRRKEFWGLEFVVDERVLVPRPDTETLVEEASAILAARPARRILDLCTGSGCLAITLQHLFPQAQVEAADISRDALDVCELNAVALLGRPLFVIQSDLFEHIEGEFDLIVSNSPYLTDDETRSMKQSGWPEPALALAGGLDGTDLLVRIVGQALRYLTPGGSLVLEADPEQMKKVADCLARCGYINIGTRRDLGGRERALRGVRPVQ
jgi:release factor glutamine methyltransferase